MTEQSSHTDSKPNADQGNPANLTSVDLKTLKPGDNPNKANKHRRKVRPRVKNHQTSDPLSTLHKWAEPIECSDAVFEGELKPIQTSFPIATIEIDPCLPYTMASPYHDIYLNSRAFSGRNEQLVEAGANAIESTAFFKCAKQCYCTMDDADKSAVNKLKSVFYEGTELPSHLTAAIGMIGNFDSKLGKVKLQHPVLLFKRWVAAGIVHSPDHSATYKNINYDEALTYVWRDKFSIAYIRDVIVKTINANRRTFQVGEGNQAADVTSPEFDTDQPLRWANRLHQNEPNRQRWQAYARIFAVSDRNWSNPNFVIAHLTPQQTVNALRELDLELAPDGFTDIEMSDEFNDIMRKFQTKYMTSVKQIFNTSPNSASNMGFPAQFVASSGNMAHYKIPLSDADIGLGFMFNPCKSFTISSDIQAVSKDSSGLRRSQFASLDSKSVLGS